jgi:hypothetical protein
VGQQAEQLADTCCLVYSVRPLACGPWTSTSAERCEQSWRGGWSQSIAANQMQLCLYG